MHAWRLEGFARSHPSQVSNSSGAKLFSLTSWPASASNNPALSVSAICFPTGDYTTRGGYHGEFLAVEFWREDGVSTGSDSDRFAPIAALLLLEIVTPSLPLPV